MSAAPCGKEVQAKVALLNQDRWFITGHETTKTTVELCAAHAKTYRDRSSKNKCQVAECNNEGAVTVVHGRSHR